MKVTVILIEVGALRAIPKNLKKIKGTDDQRKNREKPDHSTAKKDCLCTQEKLM